MPKRKAALDDIQPGAKVRQSMGAFASRLLHIVVIVEEQVVFKHWSYRQRRWIYEIESLYIFGMMCKDERFELVWAAAEL